MPARDLGPFYRFVGNVRPDPDAVLPVPTLNLANPLVGPTRSTRPSAPNTNKLHESQLAKLKVILAGLSGPDREALEEVLDSLDIGVADRNMLLGFLAGTGGGDPVANARAPGAPLVPPTLNFADPVAEYEARRAAGRSPSRVPTANRASGATLTVPSLTAEFQRDWAARYGR